MRGETVQACFQRRGRAAVRGLGLYLMSGTVGWLLFSLMVLALSSITNMYGLLLVPIAAALIQRYANFFRRLIGQWTGVAIPVPYLPEPEPEQKWIYQRWNRFVHSVSDPATWRDTLWLFADPIVGLFTALLPAALIAEGVYGWLLGSGLWQAMTGLPSTDWYTFVPMNSSNDNALQAGLLGTVYVVLGLWFAPRLLEAYGKWSRLLLAPTEKARLALRVQHLTETRSDAVDAQAAELRRIERDLHDGAQARLVAMGMSLGAIEHLMDRDPAKARLLLTEAREASAKALSELRDLVRGIHPPVLADRGLADAVRALALDNPLNVEVAAELSGRPEPPVESAAYFAVAEVLTNAVKHSGARRVWIDLRHENGSLRISVTDDGHGGASLDGGTGLRGIERRIGTFDGILAVSSPPGGPTIVTMELPCALSSPKTSLS